MTAGTSGDGRLVRLSAVLETVVVALAVGALAFRATMYWQLPAPPGRSYGTGDVIDFGLGLTLLAGLFTAVVLGVIYTIAIVLIPFIYVNFAATVFFGIAIGAAVGWTAKFGKIRHGLTIGILGTCFGFVGLYAAWSADPLARLGIEDGGILLEPTVLFKYMSWCYENGTWGFTRRISLMP